jgi:hypothetical protein
LISDPDIAEKSGTSFRVTVSLHKCIKQVLNKFSDVMPEELLDELPPRRQVDHVIKVMLEMAPPAKAPYRMNHEK